MSTTPIFGSEHLQPNSSDPEVPVNSALDAIERGVNSTKEWTVTGDFNASQEEMAEGVCHELNGSPSAPFSFGIYPVARLFKVKNNTEKTVTVHVQALSGVGVDIPPEDFATLLSDGTNLVRVDAATWNIASKSSDQSRTNTTVLAADSDLTFPMAASGKYRLRGVVYFDCGATEDFKYGFDGPSSPDVVRMARHHNIAGGTAAEVAGDVAYPTNVSLAGAGTTGGFIQFEGVVHNGVNAGTFSFQWSQNTSGSTPATVRAGSYLEWKRVA